MIRNCTPQAERAEVPYVQPSCSIQWYIDSWRGPIMCTWSMSPKHVDQSHVSSRSNYEQHYDVYTPVPPDFTAKACVDIGIRSHSCPYGISCAYLAQLTRHFTGCDIAPCAVLGVNIPILNSGVGSWTRVRYSTAPLDLKFNVPLDARAGVAYDKRC